MALNPNRTKASIFKRGAPALPGGLNETSFFVYSGQILAITFNRAPNASEIIVHRMSDQAELARWPWPGGFGSIVIDTDGSLHIFGTTQASSYVAGNQVIHSVLDPNTFQPSGPVAVYTAPIVPGNSYTVPNIGVCKSPNGYVMAVDLFLTQNQSQGRSIFLQAPSLSGTWTRFGSAFSSADTMYVGAFKPFYVSAGRYPNRCYMVYNSATGGQPGFPTAPFWMNIAYTDDFNTFVSYDGKGECYSFPDCPIYDGTNSSDGSEPFEFNGDVYVPRLAGDQATWSVVHLDVVKNKTLDAFLADFGM